MSAKYKVLVIDDEELIRAELRRAFELAEYDVFTTETPNQAIDILAKELFDVIIIDMRFADDEHGGLRIAQVLGWNASAVPIVYTAFPSYKECVKVMREGAWDYISKNERDSIQTLLESAEQGLNERLSYHPSGDAQWFQKNISRLQDKYSGEVVAVVDGEVIDHDRSYDRLKERVKGEPMPFFGLVPVADAGRSEPEGR